MLFVTGATGFLGHSLVPYLAGQGYRLRVLVRAPEHHAWLNNYAVEVVKGDLSQQAHLRQVITGCRYVVHAAGLFRMWGRAEEFDAVNVQGSLNILEAAAAAGVARLIHISTIAVVGTPQAGRIIDETHPPYPVDAYQHSKLAGEQAARHVSAERGLPVIILRPGAFYGPHGRYAFNRLFFEDPLKGLLFKVDHGNNLIFPVLTWDVAAGVHLAIQYGRPGEIYNICDDPISHNQANAIISRLAHIPYLRLNLPRRLMIEMARVWTGLSQLTGVEPYYPINLKSYVFNNWPVSNQKARDDLGFVPTPFDEGARQTLDWYRSCGFWWARRIKSR